jgi:chemotaxis protein methyltransferase CheR
MFTTITDQEFGYFQRFIFDAAGIALNPSKKALVSGRLSKRLQQRNVRTFSEYFQLLSSGKETEEVQIAIDLLTTNETYFFREPKHFEVLRRLALSARETPGSFRVWSAACSTGEEPYSIAMTLEDVLAGRSWEVIGSDISLRVLQKARVGHYPMTRTKQIPIEYLRRFCLKGTGEQEGTLLVERNLRSRVQFLQINLNEVLPRVGAFDVIFLRNVLIYFNAETKRSVVSRILSALKPGGYFLIGHSETLNDISNDVKQIAPSIYRKPTTAP